MSNDKEYKMTQCLLEREGNIFEVSWIPSNMANKKNIRVKDGEGNWVDWRVKEKYTSETSSKIFEFKDDYRRHREATDI